jgi:hypothetical protein
MTLPWEALLWSGLVATTANLFVLGAGSAFGWLRYRPTALVGTAVLPTPHHPTTETLGVIIIFGLGTGAFPPLYYLLMGGEPSLGWGALLGLLHGVLVLAALPLYGRVSPAVREGTLDEPGLFGVRWGARAMAAIVAGHLVYGVVIGGVLAAFAAPAF